MLTTGAFNQELGANGNGANALRRRLSAPRRRAERVADKTFGEAILSQPPVIIIMIVAVACRGRGWKQDGLQFQPTQCRVRLS
jgi:hypothetical protein